MRKGRAARLRKLTLREDGDDVEVRPPQRGDGDHPQDRGRDDAGSDRDAAASDADRDDRLPERDHDDEPVALGEVGRRDAPALPAADEGAQIADGERNGPERGLRAAVDESGGENDRGCQRGRWRETHDRPEQVRIVLPGDRIQQDVEQTHDQVGDPEQHRICSERLRDGDGDDEHRSHRSEHARPTWPSSGSSVFVSQA